MRVLLADPDRDLLSGYQRLMETDGDSVKTAFDGTQVLNLLGSGMFDLAILNEQLPRIAHERLIHGLREEHIPVIALLTDPVHIRRLCRTEPASAYLSFPFFPSELKILSKSVVEKAGSVIRLDCMGVQIEIHDFRFAGSDVFLTANEIDILTRLSKEEIYLRRQERVYAHSLNEKLSKLNGPLLHVAYQEKKGYRLVRMI